MLLSVVIPTYNEHDNIAVLLDHLVNELSKIQGAYEVIVVDDASPDGTSVVVEQYTKNNSAIRLMPRTGKRDLSAALAMGFDGASGEYVAAIDADLQHDPALLVSMLAAIESRKVDLVVATRYAQGGGIANWNGMRRALSCCATRLSAYVVRTRISDPLSGYFIFRKKLWVTIRSQVQLSGFKILLEIISVARGISSAEIGYQFIARQRGRSKLDVTAGLAFLFALPHLFLNARKSGEDSF